MHDEWSRLPLLVYIKAAVSSPIGFFVHSKQDKYMFVAHSYMETKLIL